MSTLDLVEPDCFTVLTASDGRAWEDASRELDVPIEIVRIGIDVADPDGWWISVAGIGPGGVLLVRPDQHVAFRSAGAVDDPSTVLQRAIEEVLRRDR
jgi:2,4-dichlorophenol 6-monooxygenase